MNYYSENDPVCVNWLKNLMAEKLIPAGEIDDRSICDVKAKDLKGYTQHHFFAGIGGWPYALHLAGWPTNRVSWTGSCPCQPFSMAGRRRGFADERHLWPTWFNLIRQCRPPIIFGEQVVEAIKQHWLDLVFDDLESEDYSCAATVLPACSIGAPHIRQRIWFVADHDTDGFGKLAPSRLPIRKSRHDTNRRGADDRLADSTIARRQARRTIEAGSGETDEPRRFRKAGDMGDTIGARSQGRRVGRNSTDQRAVRPTGMDGPVAVTQGSQLNGGGDAGRRRGQPANGCWDDIQWLPCTDGKIRPTQPGLFPLAGRVSGRVGRLRAYGNAVVAPLAAEFIKAYSAARGIA